MTHEQTPSRPKEVLFVCTHNSARSIMAEAILNRLGRGALRAHSAGSHPSGQLQPLALKTLSLMQMSTEGFRSKDKSEFAQPGAPRLDFVFTVYDRAAGEACPVWPGQPMTAHRGVPDPAAVEGSEEQKAKACWGVATVRERRIELLLALPLGSLDRLSIQRVIRGIGAR